MQKKKINTILIIAVALIWAVVLFKFISPYFTSADTVITADVLVKPAKAFMHKKDTFNLSIPKRDPFLGKSTGVKKKVVASSKPRKVSRPKVSQIKNWPRIEYLGFVKSSKSTSRLGLLRINGVLKRVRNGSQVGDVSVKIINENYISVVFQREVKDFDKIN
ncbi:hypothetical protein [Aquimarina sp. MMG016]|uniref:hypothetical protein n=1 Tax=Aquimarina sp. MMG016 TaxID=2822690 RepID=UPI001B3A0A7C|nr:hypothetical protein [Aquimarina sp. MMG016]MBQ4821398.1 hypothetical protein [Aquimarina sp. MMG016]